MTRTRLDEPVNRPVNINWPSWDCGLTVSLPRRHRKSPRAAEPPEFFECALQSLNRSYQLIYRAFGVNNSYHPLELDTF